MPRLAFYHPAAPAGPGNRRVAAHVEEIVTMLEIRPGTADDREWIYRLRHEVYARELGQHAPNQAGRLTDELDGDNVYLVAASGAEPVGFVSVTPPWAGRYSIDKYLPRDGHPSPPGQDALFEIRILTVAPRWRGSTAAVLLMHAALRWVAAHGGRTVVALGRADGWRLDLNRLRDTLRERYDLVVIVNPNNPTGVYTDADELRRVIEDAPGGTRFWLDEAYAEYVAGARSLEPYAAASGNVVVCKSMSKMYALSGLRVAYLAGPAEIVAGIRRWAPPWGVSLPAQIAAVHALRDPGHYAARWAETRTLRAGVARGLAAIGGDLRVDESVANFVLLTLPRGGPGAGRLVAACRRRGVFLRDLSPMSPAFEGRTVRVSVRDAAANERVAATVATALRDRA
ncbi:aminotransferase class I/II-fold pyridoxal phosphate-dependent enzyme [Nonomuraea sp. NPDC002799]